MIKSDELPPPPPSLQTNETRPLVKSIANPFYFPIPPEPEPLHCYRVQMQSAIPCQGCRVRRQPLPTSDQVGSVEWEVHPDNIILVQGLPHEGPPIMRSVFSESSNFQVVCIVTIHVA